jgi:hypothetical protein
MRPQNQELQDVIRRLAPEAFDPVDTGTLVGNVSQGINKLAGSTIDATVWSLIGEFRASFRGVAVQTKILAGYKALHDGLHNLQLRMPSVEFAAVTFPSDPIQSKLLAREVIYLRDQSRWASEMAAALPTKGLEQLWIDDLRQAADEMGEILKSKDKANSRMPHVVTVLRSVLQEMYRIDGQLATTVAELPLESLIEALAQIAGRLTPGEVSNAISSARDALVVIRPQLEALVAIHNEWQWLNKALAGIETNPGRRPEEKVFGWLRARKRLQSLCGVFAATEWSVDLLALIAAWEKAAEAGEDAESDQAAVQLNATVANRFFEADTDLLHFSGQLTEIGGPITNLLRSSPNGLA